MRRLRELILAVSSLVACEMVMEELPVDKSQNEAFVQVRFSPEVAGETKSSISPDEDYIHDINVYAFRDGMLVDEVYSTSLDKVTLMLPTGYSYDIYAVANAGMRRAVAFEDKFVDGFEYSIGSLSEIGPRMPMSCVCRNVNVSRNTKIVTLQMERNVAKIVLSVDKVSLLEGLQVKSVRLCQSSSVVRPFKWSGQGGSRAESEDEVIMGDYATDIDLGGLNSGDPVVFYALENCQGILLPDNKDPLAKTPDNIGDKETLCTYLEVCAAFGSDGILEGDVNYRIYLGLDSVSSFDVPGNSCINVSLKLTDDGLRNVSWKVDADVSVRDGYVYGYVEKGLHRMNDLYVGEKVLYEVELAGDLMEYIDGNLSGCRLVFMSDDEESDGMSVEYVSADDNVLQTVLSCVKPVAGELVLYGPDGTRLGCVEKTVTIKIPRAVFSEYATWNESDPVEPLTYAPECEISGNPAEFHLYMVDEDGRNLNGDGSYDYDAELFDFHSVSVSSAGTSVAGVWAEFEPDDSGQPGAPAASVSVFCDNDGTDHSVNVLLADIYNDFRPVSVQCVDSAFGIAKPVSVELAIPQISLTLVDNGWAKYHDSQLSVVVDNPSNLPLEVSVWQLLMTNTKYGAVDGSYVENNLKRETMHYMTGEFYNGNPPLYGSKASFVSERNDCGSAALEKGDTMVYPLSGINTDDIRKAIYYDKRGNHQMMHMVDVTLNGKRIRIGDVALEDKVSDGSAKYEYIYYNEDSWNYRGAGLSSAGESVSFSGMWSYDYPNVNAHSLDGLWGRYSTSQPVYATFGYNSSTEKITLLTNAKNSVYDFTMSVLFQGQVNGYVQTYPRGTWYEPQDNYCTVDFEHVTTGLPLKVNSTFVWADEGKVKDAIDGIYEFSYRDSPKGAGGDPYMHRAHPMDFDLNVSCAVEGDNKNELYPLEVDWKFDNISYYHQQDDANYKCLLDAVSEGFTMVVVTPR